MKQKLCMALNRFAAALALFTMALLPMIGGAFASAALAQTTYSAWAPSATPATAAWPDSSVVEVGVKFRVDTPGFISGVRFYKGTSNTGTHVATLWTSAGVPLASATFLNESASGWQQADFTTPVTISADTVYVASYHSNVGHYAGDPGYFASAGVDNGPLHLLQNGVSGGNGVYAYGPLGTFPGNSFGSANYWVDVVFTTGVPPTATPTLTPPPPTATRTATATATGPTPTATATIPATQTATLAPPTATRTSTATNVPATATATATATLPPPECLAPANEIVAENCLPGNPASQWEISGAGDATIQGFATDISVNRGQTVSFKIATDALDYRVEIYRLGYYGGLGARLVATVLPSAALPQTQPTCLSDPATGLVDCGNWGVSATWDVPADAVSGIYIARPTRTDTEGASHIPFVVRHDGGGAELLFQTSDTSWQAYNTYGGNSLYFGSPAGRAYKVSYNRPFTTRCCAFPNGGLQGNLFDSEFPMVRWLERNGYDVSYITGVDTDRSAAELLDHAVFMSVGHDEYWSGTQRANVEAARAAGVHLAFFSGNQMFWKTRWEPSIDGSGTDHRTLVCYKETHADAKIDPLPGVWTGTWRDARFGPHDGGRPENALSGSIFMVNGIQHDALKVPAADGKMRFWRGTDIASQTPGHVETLPAGTLGFEWDEDLDNGARPPGLVRLSTALVTDVPLLQDNGSTYAPGAATHHLAFYRHASGALVFAAGTVQWAWGLDPTHDASPGSPTDQRMQQATVNLFADMGVQPATLQDELLPATASTDAIAPTSTITSPTTGSAVPAGGVVAVSGTAADTGGGVVGAVEVSTDGGSTWHPADGRETWTYQWTVPSGATATLRSRAVDDSGNIETPGSGVTVTIFVATATPTPTGIATSIWAPNVTPGIANQPDGSAVELGVKFRSDIAGLITGVRFYKSTANTGTHTGSLWTSTGTLLATAVFSGETASGWQQVSFTSPVSIAANTVYVASYHTNVGHYAGDADYFAAAGVDNPPLHALRNGVSGGNGVYLYGAGGFPTNSFRSANYWVDVVFAEAATPTPTVQPPTATATATVPTATPTITNTPLPTSTATITGAATATATSTRTITATATVTSTAANTATQTLTATPTYTPTVTPIPTTVPTATPIVGAVTIWSASATPVVASQADPSAVELGVKFRADVNGLIHGVRFYKSASNTGTHTGSLWSSTGTQLATATFSDETPSGWQQVTFAAPVAVTANSVYVASYHTNTGHYAGDVDYFLAAGFDNPPLHALQDGISGGNGVYSYGASAFPANTFRSANYWVDVIFTTAP